MSHSNNCTALTMRDMYGRMYQWASMRDAPDLSCEIDAHGNTNPRRDTAGSISSNEIWLFGQDEAYKRFLHSLLEIEDFVASVVSSDKPAFKVVENALGRAVLNELPLAEYFHRVYAFAIQLESSYEYSLNVQLFIDCWMKLKLGDMIFNRPRGHTPVLGKMQFEFFNEFIDLIRTEFRSPEFRKKISRGKEKFSKRYRRAELYIDALFNNRATQMLVLRLDFGYQKDIAKQITIAEAKEDLVHFLNNKRGNHKLFKGWLGYIRKLEWAPQKGFYFHLIAFMDCNHSENHSHVARQLGSYWEKVTDNRGAYWNGIDSVFGSKRLGIGEIDISDIDKRTILLDDVVVYLAKTDQQLRPKLLGGSMGSNDDDPHKLFVMGRMPRQRISEAGSS